MAIARDCAQRIKHSRVVVGKSVEMSKGDSPENGFECMEAGGEQGGTGHHHNEDAGGVRAANKSVENLARRLVDEPQTEHMDDHRDNDQGHTPCPIFPPDSRVSVE